MIEFEDGIIILGDYCVKGYVNGTLLELSYRGEGEIPYRNKLI